MAVNLHIVTPSRNLLSVTCDDVVLPGYDGEMGVLSQHAHFVNKLGAGVVKIHKGGSTEKLAISGGVVEIGNDQVTVLADEAVLPKEVDLAKVEVQQKALSEKLLTLDDGSHDREKLFARQGWLTAQVNLVKAN